MQIGAGQFVGAVDGLPMGFLQASPSTIQTLLFATPTQTVQPLSSSPARTVQLSPSLATTQVLQSSFPPAVSTVQPVQPSLSPAGAVQSSPSLAPTQVLQSSVPLFQLPVSTVQPPQSSSQPQGPTSSLSPTSPTPPTQPPLQPSGQLSGGEIAAIIIVLIIVALGTLMVIGTTVYYIKKRRGKYTVMTPSRPNEYSAYVTDANIFAKPSEMDEHDGTGIPMESETKLDSPDFVVNPSALESDEDVAEKETLMRTQEESKQEGKSS